MSSRHLSHSALIFCCAGVIFARRVRLFDLQDLLDRLQVGVWYAIFVPWNSASACSRLVRGFNSGLKVSGVRAARRRRSRSRSPRPCPARADRSSPPTSSPTVVLSRARAARKNCVRNCCSGGREQRDREQSRRQHEVNSAPRATCPSRRPALARRPWPGPVPSRLGSPTGGSRRRLRRRLSGRRASSSSLSTSATDTTRVARLRDPSAARPAWRGRSCGSPAPACAGSCPAR